MSNLKAYKEIIQLRIESLKNDSEKEEWNDIKVSIKGRIAAYEEVLKDIEQGVLT